jgi:hypothetical protein
MLTIILNEIFRTRTYEEYILFRRPWVRIPDTLWEGVTYFSCAMLLIVTLPKCIVNLRKNCKKNYFSHNVKKKEEKSAPAETRVPARRWSPGSSSAA